MRREDRQVFVETLIGFAELKGRQLSAPALELFWNAMQDWTIEEFRAAANHLLRTCEFMPTPKDFYDLRRAERPTAGDAWAKVLDHLKGGYRNGAGLTPEIDRAVRAMGGYRALAMMPVDQLPWQAKRFADAYADVGTVLEAQSALAPPANVVSLLERVRP